MRRVLGIITAGAISTVLVMLLSAPAAHAGAFDTLACQNNNWNAIWSASTYAQPANTNSFWTPGCYNGSLWNYGLFGQLFTTGSHVATSDTYSTVGMPSNVYLAAYATVLGFQTGNVEYGTVNFGVVPNWAGFAWNGSAYTCGNAYWCTAASNQNGNYDGGTYLNQAFAANSLQFETQVAACLLDPLGAQRSDSCGASAATSWQGPVTQENTVAAPPIYWASGGLWGGTVNGTQSVTWYAPDPTGDLRDLMYIDGADVADTGNYACNYYYVSPCDYGGNNEPTLSYNTAARADGTHSISLNSANTGGDWGTANATYVSDNWPPSNTVAPIIGGSQTVGSTLYDASNGSWANNNNGNFSYQWQDCNAAETYCPNIPGATGSSYTPTWSDAGSYIRMVNWLCDPLTGCGYGYSNMSGQVTGYTPTNTAAPTVSGTAQVGQPITDTSNGSWSGNTDWNFLYQWQDCDGSGNNCASIANATGTTYTPSWSELGDTVRLTNELCNPYSGCGFGYSAPTNAVSGYYPINTVAPVVSGNPVQGSILTVTNPGTWIDTTSVSTPLYQWQDCNSVDANCTNITGATSSTYTIASSDDGHDIQAVVTECNYGNLCTPSNSTSYSLAPSALSATSTNNPFATAAFSNATAQIVDYSTCSIISTLGQSAALLFPGGPTISLIPAPGTSGTFKTSTGLQYQISDSVAGAIRQVSWRVDDRQLPDGLNYTVSIPNADIVAARVQTVTATIYPRQQVASGASRPPVVLTTTFNATTCS
jgi:hypothetical protein